MEESFLRCYRCMAVHDDIPLEYIDADGNIYCRRCSHYLLKVGGYDLDRFDIGEFLYYFHKGEDKE